MQGWVPDGQPGGFVAVDGDQKTMAFQIVNGRAVRWYAAVGHDGLRPGRAVYQTRTLLGLMAALAALASITTLVGLAVRDRREMRQTPTQARASLVQTTISLLWLVAMAVLRRLGRRAERRRADHVRMAGRLDPDRVGLRPGRPPC